MMRNPFKFFIELSQQVIWIPVWVYYLMIINLASVGFWSETVAQTIFITLIFSSMLMMGLYSKFGFENILGLGHILWLPLLFYVLIEIPAANGVYQSYLIILSVSIAISLVFDVMDVWKYFLSKKNSLQH